MPKQNQTKSQYLESLQKNVPEQQVQSKADYLAQVKQNKQNQQIDQLNYQEQLDKINEDFAKNKKYDKSFRKPFETDIDKRVKRINKFTGSGPMTAASMGASFIKPIGQMAPGALGTALQGGLGGFFQGGMKSVSSGSNVARSLQRRQYLDKLGAVGKVEQGSKALSNALRLSYSYNLLKGIAGAASGAGSIAPTSSMYGTMSGVVGNPAMMALTGAKILSSMMGSKKRRQLMLMRRPNPEEFIQKFSKAQFLDPFYRRLRSQDQIEPYQQLTYMLLSYIESYTSVLPSLYTDLKFLKDQKDKAGDQVKQEKEKASEKYSLVSQFEDAINTVVTKYDPVAQLTSFIFGKTTPKKILDDIQKGKGLTGGQLRAHEDKAREIGISSNQLRLIDINSASLISSGQSYEAKMLALSSASYDINRLMAQESITIRKHGFGIEHNKYSKPITKENVFIRLFNKFDDLIQYMPVISAGYNIVKDTLKYSVKGAQFLKGAFNFGKDIFFGKDFLRFGDQREVDKELGIYKTAEKRSTEFIADGLPTNLEKIRTLGAQRLDIQLNIFDVLKNQYELMHQQITGQASGFEYEQRVSDEIIHERFWDSFERKMLSAEGLEKSIDKKAKMRQLKREKAFEKSILGAVSIMQSGFTKDDPEERMEKLFDPLNKFAKTLTGKEAYFAGSKLSKQWEKDDDIRFAIKGQNVRDIDLEIERKKQDAQDIVGTIGTSIGSMIGVGAAAALGPLGLVLTGAMPIAKFMSSQYFDKRLYEEELEKLGSSNVFGRNITSLQDEAKKRDPIKDKEFSTILLDQTKTAATVVPDKLDNIYNLFDERSSKIINLLSIPRTQRLTGNLISAADDYGSSVIEAEIKAAAAAGGGRLSPFTIVGEKGPELIIGNQVYNEDQVREKFGFDIINLLRDKNITKLADGGELPSDQSKASDYSIFSKIYNVLLKIKNGVIKLSSPVIDYFKKSKNTLNFVPSRSNKILPENVISINSRIKEDIQEKEKQEDIKRQGRIIEIQTEIADLTRKNFTVLERLGIAYKDTKSNLMAIFTGILPLITAGAAFAAMWATDFKIGTTAVAGIFGKVINAIFKGVAKFFDTKMVTTIGETVAKHMPFKSLFTMGTGFLAKIFPGLTKGGLKVGAKTLGKMIPGLGMIFGTYFAGKRLLKGDYVGALGEFAGGIASTFLGVGTALSLGIDTWLFLRDKSRDKQIEQGEDISEDPASFKSNFLKIGSKLGAYLFGKATIKTIGKKIPFLGAPIGAYFAWQRIKKHDIVGGLLELASGLSSLIPGIGTAFGFGIDIFLAMRDYKTTEEERVGVNGLDPIGFIKNIAKNISLWTKNFLSNLPLVGLWFKNWFDDGSLEVAEMGMKNAYHTQQEAKSPFIKLKESLKNKVANAVGGIKFIGGWIKSKILGEESEKIESKIINEKPVDEDSMFKEIALNLKNKFLGYLSNLGGIGTRIANWFKGKKDTISSTVASSNVKDDLEQAIKDTSKNVVDFTQEQQKRIMGPRGFAKGGVLSPLSIVGEEGPELIIGNRVLNRDQVRETLGMDIQSIINNTSISKFKDGGTLPTSNNEETFLFTKTFKNIMGGLTSLVKGFFNLNEKISDDDFKNLTEPTNTKLDKHVSNLDIVSKIKNHIIASEGIALKKYNDHLGNPTIGIGHLIQPNEKFPDKITIDTAKSLFDKDFNVHSLLSSKLPVFNKLSDVRKGALIDLIFNMGLGKVKEFKKTLSYLEQENYNEAAKELLRSKYANQVGDRARRVSKLIETNSANYFNSNKPQIIKAAEGGQLGPISVVGEKGPELIIGNQVLNRNQVRETLGLDIQSIIDNASIPKFSEGGLFKKAKEYDQIKLDSIIENSNQNPTQRKEKQENTKPIIIDNSTNTNSNQYDSSTKENTEGSFTKIDDSLDRIIYNIFNTSVNIMSQAPTNFVFNNDFSFDF